jgi:hypothetical protein
MSMLNFYINRAGNHLSKSRLATLDRAKGELCKDFGKNPQQTNERAHHGATSPTRE